MREAARAKVNLFLHVGVRRADGFHELESLVAFADVGDALSFEPADALSLAIDGPFASALQSEPDNLVLKAARALAAHAGIEPHAKITLIKNLPIASGIGGGSADAAAALRGLCDLWNLSPSRADLNEIALSLGSDVPVCLVTKSAWMTGRGEHLAPISLPRVSMVLVNPGISISTAEVFANLHSRSGVGTPKPGAIHSVDELIAYLKSTTNDLETSARAIAPIIEEALTALLNCGALLARMSGSGATCFGIFEDDAKASAAANIIAKSHLDWWVKAG
jgi:4-diphosphocytidyl-2-C-methyl-D-erythritol kinase